MDLRRGQFLFVDLSPRATSVPRQPEFASGFRGLTERIFGCSRQMQRATALADQFLHDVAVHVGEAEIATGVPIREFLVIEAQQVQ